MMQRSGLSNRRTLWPYLPELTFHGLEAFNRHPHYRKSGSSGHIAPSRFVMFAERVSERQLMLSATIFDVDGVLLASPHERAWREALRGFAEPDRFTTAMYQAHVAGKPRLSSARAALEQLGVPDAEHQAAVYAQRKQKRVEELIAAKSFTAFPDAIRFVQAVKALGLRMAVASSSKNANQMLQLIELSPGAEFA